MLTHDRAYLDTPTRCGLNILTHYEELGVVFGISGATRDIVTWSAIDGPPLTPWQQEWIEEHRALVLLALRYRARRCGACGAARDRPDCTWCDACTRGAAARHHQRLLLTTSQQKKAIKSADGPTLTVVPGGQAREARAESEPLRFGAGSEGDAA